MGSFRLERVANLIAKEISSLILEGKIKDHRVTPLVTVTRVEISSDLAHAKVWISSMNQKPEALNEAVMGMNSAAGFIQSILGKKLKTRYTPCLIFKPDHSLKEAIEIQNKLKEVFPNEEK